MGIKRGDSTHLPLLRIVTELSAFSKQLGVLRPVNEDGYIRGDLSI